MRTFDNAVSWRVDRESVVIRTEDVASMGRRAPQFVRFAFFMRNDAPTHCHGTCARDALILLFFLPFLTL